MLIVVLSAQLQQENASVLMLVQAMLGAISPNFRAVSLQIETGGVVHLYFILENENADDREEIDDLVCEFEALSGGPVSIVAHVEIYSGEWAAGADSIRGRPVFMRKWTA